MATRPAQHRRRATPALLTGIVLVASLSALHLIPSPAPARADAPPASVDPDDLTTLEDRFKTVADRVAPAVVAISASLGADDSPAACRCAEMTAEKLQAFLARTTRIVGTGFIFEADGYVLTNDHVIDEAQQLWVTTDDRRVYPAIVVGSDPRSDLAVLKIPGHGLPVVHFGDGGAARRGQWSVAVGNPYGLSADGGMCLSVGVVSAVHRSLPKLSDKENRFYANLIQTTAQINPGNSGGPLFDLHGDVIGINTAVILPQKATNGIGFALPIDAQLLATVHRLQAGDEVVYGYLGVIVSNLTDAERRAAGLLEATGAHVDTVQPDSPAAGGVMRADDVIVAINGQPVADSDAFVRLVGSSPVGRPVEVVLMRDGQRDTRSVLLRKRTLPVPAVTRATQRLRWGGMSVGSLPPDQGAGLLVLNVSPTSPFAKRGLHDGSVIRTVAGHAVTAVADLQRVINDTPFDQCDIAADPDQATASVRE